MVFLFITAIEVLTGTWRGRRSLGAVGTGWDNVLLPRLQGTASPGHQVSKPAEGKISIWIRKRKRRASEAFPQGKRTFRGLLPAGPIGPSHSFAGIRIQDQSMRRMSRIEVEHIDQRTSQRVERTVTYPAQIPVVFDEPQN
jgi:hypothetical protein